MLVSSCGNAYGNKTPPAVSFVVNFNLKWVWSVPPYQLMQHKNTWEAFISLLRLFLLFLCDCWCTNIVTLNLAVEIQTWSECPSSPLSWASSKHFCKVTSEWVIHIQTPFSQFQWQKMPPITARICFYFWKM